MQEQTSKVSKDAGASFLLVFTKELIRNTSAYKSLIIKKEVKKLETRLAEPPDAGLAEEIKKEEIKELVKEKIKSDSRKVSEMEKSGFLPSILSRPLQKQAQRLVQKPVFLQAPRTLRKPAKLLPPMLRIQEPALPPTVSYLRPQPTAQEIDLGKLNILVKDPLVKIIECNGPDENILVIGMMGRKPTSVKLGKEEIDEILKRFSTASKIPVHEGLFKAALGNLVISAVISEEVGIKFMVRKISPRF